MDPNSLIAAILSNDDASPKEKPKRHPVLRQAQFLQLRERWLSVHGSGEPEHVGPFAAGDCLVEKPGIPLMNHAPLLLLWRRLDPLHPHDSTLADEHLRSHNTLCPERFDCLVAVLSDDASHLSFVPHSTRLLQPWDGSDPE